MVAISALCSENPQIMMRFAAFRSALLGFKW